MKYTGEQLCAWSTSLAVNRQMFQSFYQAVQLYVRPEIDVNLTPSGNSRETDPRRIWDSTAITCNQTLANGLMSSLTPKSDQWFRWKPKAQGSEMARQWCAAASQTAHEILSESNWSECAHHAYAHVASFGTMCVYLDSAAGLSFDVFPPSAVNIGEGPRRKVDTVFREYQLSLKQCVQEFGKEALSPAVQRRCEQADRNAATWEEKIWLIHGVYPRIGGKIDAAKGDEMPFASCTAERDNKHAIRESGFRAQRYIVARFLPHDVSPYGLSPAWMAMAEILDANDLRRQTRALAELRISPRTLIPVTLQGMLDMRPAGITYYDPTQPGGKPEEWLSTGDMRAGRETLEETREAIRDAFYFRLFRQFLDTDKEMTAREVAARERETVRNFSPVFARLTGEFLKPATDQIFEVLYLGGAFGPAPEEMLGEDGAFDIPPVQWTGPLAIAMEAAGVAGFGNTVALLQPVAESDPGVYRRVFNFRRLAPELARMNGVPADWFNTPDEIDAIEEAEAAAAQQQQQMQQAQQVAQSAAALGKVPPGNLERLAGNIGL